MEPSPTTMLRIGDWRVDPAAGQISRNGETARVEERAMRLLLCLAEHAGEVVSIDDLLRQVWSDVSVSPDSVYQAVTSLRRLLRDDPRQPAYIATVPRLGYRMIAKVGPWDSSAIQEVPTSRAENAREMGHPEWCGFPGKSKSPPSREEREKAPKGLCSPTCVSSWACGTLSQG